MTDLEKMRGLSDAYVAAIGEIMLEADEGAAITFGALGMAMGRFLRAWIAQGGRTDLWIEALKDDVRSAGH